MKKIWPGKLALKNLAAKLKRIVDRIRQRMITNSEASNKIRYSKLTDLN